ncbi:MAG: hypothetical protein H8E36_02590 [Rhodospirillaceae bacterium]|nr:hypothetical protein [Rhodospirillaceae bacterium]MBL6941289.1 hypothetical protein [Rhodospirillales bacterium]
MTKDKTPVNFHSWGLEKQTAPSITEQVETVKKMREEDKKKTVQNDEEKTKLVGGSFKDILEGIFDSSVDIPDRISNPKNNEIFSPKANTGTAEEGKQIAKEIGAIVGLEAVGAGLKAKGVVTKGPNGAALDKLGDVAFGLADHLKDQWGYKR